MSLPHFSAAMSNSFPNVTTIILIDTVPAQPDLPTSQIAQSNYEIVHDKSISCSMLV